MKILLTGTRAYGPAREDSDIDIVILVHTARAVADLLESLGVDIVYPENEDYSGFKFQVDKFTVNIVSAASMQEFARWRFATAKMKELPPIEGRQARIDLFRSFWGSAKV